MRLYISTITCFIIFSTSTYATTSCLDTLQVKIWQDLVYNNIDDLELKLDLFLSKETGTEQNLIILLPGERMRSRSEFNCMAGMLAEQGFTVAIIDYRIPPNYSYPKALDDVIEATKWLKANDDKFDIKIKSVGLVGQNFGGYLAALIGIMFPEIFQVIAPIHAPMDLTTYTFPNNYPYLYHSFLGYSKVQNPDIWVKASPLKNIQRSSPPFIFFHGTADERVAFQQTTDMDKAIKSLMGDSRIIRVDDAHNGYFNKDKGLQLTVKAISKKFKKEFWPMPDEVKVQRDLVYTSIDGRDLKMHIFSPKKKTKPLPAVLFLHGGGGMWGRKEHMLRDASELASQGYITACVEYRLVREKLFPAALDDVKAAVRWLRQNAEKLNIYPDNIGAVGNSMGAYLAAMLGLTADKEYYDQFLGPPNQSAAINAVVTISAVVDLVGLHPRDPLTTTTGFGVSLIEAPELYKNNSPTNLVTKNAANFLFIHGTEDELGNLEEVNIMAKKLQLAGVRGDVLSIENGQHNFWVYEEWRTEGMRAMVKFMDGILKGK